MTNPLYAGRSQKLFPDAEGNLKCGKCKEYKSTTSFHIDNTRTRGFSTTCKVCHKKATKERRAADPEKYREMQRVNDLRSTYKLDDPAYQRMRVIQDYCCAICFLDEEDNRFGHLELDHNDDTKTNRALLCFRCNIGGGLFDHDPVKLRAAADYWESHKEES